MPQQDHQPDQLTVAADDEARRQQQRRSRLSMRLSASVRRLVLVAVFSMLTLAAGAYVLVYGPGSPSASGPDNPGASDTPKKEYFTDAQYERKEKLAAEWLRVGSYEPTPRMKPLLDEAKRHAEPMLAAWEDGKYSEAESHFDALGKALADAEALRRQDLSAREARTASIVARQRAKDAGAPDKAETPWRKADTLNADAQRLYEQEAFTEAETTWRQAAGAFDHAQQQTLARIEAEKARDDYMARLTKRYTMEEIEAMGGAAWQRTAALAQVADAALNDQRYTIAKTGFEQARDTIGGVEQTILRVIGVHYWAFNAGYVATDVLLRRSGDKPFSGDDRKELRGLLVELMLPPAVIDALPGAPDAPYRDLATYLMDDMRDALAAARGEPAAASFAIGVQARLIERLLLYDRESMSPRDKAAMVQSINTIRGHADAIGYPDAFKAALAELAAALNEKPEFAAIQKAREVWRGVVIKLRDRDDAMELVPRGGPSP